jgi:O-antigen/teichoic acid export membrane protein
MQKRQLLLNAGMSIVQVVVLGAILFILYRYLVATIGIEQLGIWSILMATTSVSRIAELGLSGSVVKFVAKYAALSEDEKVVSVIQTAILSIGIVVGLLILAFYPCARWMLGLVVPPSSMGLALSFLPFALASLWITLLAGVLHAGLDGLQRFDQRSLILMAGAVVHLVLCLALVPKFGLMALAYAGVLQGGIVLLSSWLLLKRWLKHLPLVPRRWDRELFKEMVGYGLNFQIISIASMLYDPLVKWLLSQFGGLAAVGYYEIATRMITQFRNLLVSAYQTLVPTIANLREHSPNYIQVVYKESYHLLMYLSLPFYALIIAMSPVISELWIGRYEGTFVLFCSLLAVGWFIDMVRIPAHYANQGIGDLRWNMVGHVVRGMLNLILGLTLGTLFGSIGVIIASVASIAVCSGIISLSYHVQNRIPMATLFPSESRKVAVASAIALLFALALYDHLKNSYSPPAIASFIASGFIFVVGVPFWLHPMRKRMMRWIVDGSLKEVGAKEIRAASTLA